MNIAEAIDMLLQIFRWPALGLLICIFAAPNFARAACNVTGVDPSNDVAELETSLGTVCIELFTTDAPLHVANFLYYANNSLLVGTFFHRSVPGFVLQGGGFTVGPLDFEVVPPDNGTVTNEPCTLDTPAPPPAVPGTMICSVRGNERGTVALAKTGGDPDSGTTNFFFNLIDNRANLDNQNGGFTVFGRVLGDDMDVIDAIEALTISSDDDVAWLESLVFPSGLGAPLQQPPFFGTTYGCWDPSLQATVLDTPSLPGLAAVVDPDIATIPYTVSVGCGTPTSLATFVETPGPPQCPDVSRIAVDTSGPRSLLFPSGSASFVELTCEQLNDSLTERALWQGDFFDDFRSQLVEIETVTVPEPGVVLSWLVAGPMLFAMAKRRRR
jgi:cyclophilin family peptidyl-prolyl cis-trans isomerase